MSPGGGAADYVHAIAQALNREGQQHQEHEQHEPPQLQRGQHAQQLSHQACDYVSVLFYPQGAKAQIPVDRAELGRLGIRVVEVPSISDPNAEGGGGGVRYDPQGVVDALLELMPSKDEI